MGNAIIISPCHFFSLFHCPDAAAAADAISSQLNSVRLKLEQRRRRIEEEKRKMEQIMARQREKVRLGRRTGGLITCELLMKLAVRRGKQ